MLKLKNIVVGLALSCAAISFSVQAKVTVFAAASMTNALQEVATEYKKVKPTEDVVFSFASSSVLARQITEGAPADMFISADQKWMDFLAEKNAIVPETRVDLVGNKLVMIAPKDSKTDKVDLTNDKWQTALNNTYLSVGDPEHVPAGIYAKTAFTYLKQWDALENKLARAKNVRDALRLVEQGESPLGVVYATDAAISEKVKVVATFPAESHPPVEYPMALIKEHDNQDTRAFLDYLKSDTAKAVFKKFGFSTK
ncbi:molybdate ABC transporter substrate-binding protein [Pasteurella bettyae]|uniref:Molybdate ABC transporter, periplasmic molybdate-binding protein n=1 Tax=Pasteurella bettyae CCUG 2042 TaxID=1095749 RepID=I3DAR4_9PAST|nr:molybdate ABC transporter substrate-binding protein [Pasteurella bettyae]EIJ68807.1 molybdate ABC transporter, periplasmic molybdate-binding protein [Pasteurella bettyae CCUG 2042]SUB20884.1 molybdate ABC transporter periplasmic protein ModA [Pasteurella bettyae]